MPRTVKLVKNDIEANSISLLKYFDLEKEADVPMDSFERITNGYSSGLISVGDRKYKSVLLLLYLSQLTFKKHDCVSAGFHMNPEYKEIVTTYFGDDLCNDAVNNYETAHTTIRNLLADGEVLIYINCK